MKIFHLSIIFMLLLVPSMTFHSVKAICLSNSDWPSAPCYGCARCTPDKERQREDWNPYYQYKGTAWMEMMKTQMNSAIQNGTLQEWVGHDQANYNVWRYYYLNDQAPLFGTSAVPEFSFAIPILLISVTLLIVFYRVKCNISAKSNNLK